MPQTVALPPGSVNALQLPGIGPNPSVKVLSRSALNARVKEIALTGKLVPFGGPALQMIAPKKGDTWVNKKTYAIQWIQTNISPGVRKITLRKALDPGTIVMTISPPAPIIELNGIAGTSFVVPDKLKEDSYFTILKCLRRSPGRIKPTMWTVVSSSFQVIPLLLLA